MKVTLIRKLYIYSKVYVKVDKNPRWRLRADRTQMIKLQRDLENEKLESVLFYINFLVFKIPVMYFKEGI